jgi:hypothetical protein
MTPWPLLGFELRTMKVTPSARIRVGGHASFKVSSFLRPLTREAAQAFRIAAVSGRDPSQCR